MNISKRAKNIIKDAIIIDGQLAIELKMPWTFEEKWALIDRYAKAGFSGLTLSLANDESTTEETLTYLARIRKYIFDNPEKYILARNSEDILRAKRENKLALRLMFQGTSPIGKNLELLEIFRALGISSMLIAYNIRTPIGDGVIEANDTGLSLLGKKFIANMNKLGMIIDASHAGYQTTFDALSLTQLPMVISHSGVYGVYPHVRNIRDDQIKAVAKTGGIVGINGIGTLLGDANASVQKYVEHIDYVVKLVGVKHVAIGLDHLYFADKFNEFMQHQQITHPDAYAKEVGDTNFMKTLKPEDIGQIVETLIERGYADSDIKDILGNNILRVMKRQCM